jgi:hypothetical protein
MNETPYVIKRTEGRWAIQFCGRVFDRFEDKDDAVLTAVIQAEGARRQGRRVRVLVEENGRARAVWGEDAGAYAPRIRAPGKTARLTASDGASLF